MDRTETALTAFASGFNCAQAVLAAYCEDFGLDTPTALRLGEGFGGGVAGGGGLCGALSGAVMALGLYAGRDEAGDLAAKEHTQSLILALLARFQARHGDTACEALLRSQGVALGGKCPACAAFVETACELVDGLLLEG